MHGPFNFNATPLAPPGTKVIAHVDTTQQGTWDLNGEHGWYVGPALEHYRCITCYFPCTQSTRICDTVTFLPHRIPIPKITTHKYLQQAAEDIVHLLTHPPQTNAPSLQEGDPIWKALRELAAQLQQIKNYQNRPQLPVPRQKKIKHIEKTHQLQGCTRTSHQKLLQLQGC